MMDRDTTTTTTTTIDDHPDRNHREEEEAMKPMSITTDFDESSSKMMMASRSALINKIIIGLAVLVATMLLILGVSGRNASNRHNNMHNTPQQWAKIPWYDHAPHHGSPPPSSILFIGNSYTSVNELGTVVKEIIDHQYPQSAPLKVRSHDPGGQTFQMHLESTREDYVAESEWEDAHELRDWLITNPERDYDWVILQEQSQIPGFWDIHTDSRSDFNKSLQACIQLDGLVQDLPSGGNTLLYMTWGRRNGDEQNPSIYPDFITHQSRLEEGYKRYHKAISNPPKRPTYIAPVGKVYETIYLDEKQRRNIPNPGIANDSNLFYQLYASDGSHPSEAGTYLAALTIYTSITGEDPRKVSWKPTTLPKNLAQQIQQAVAWTILQTIQQHDREFPQYAWE